MINVPIDSVLWKYRQKQDSTFPIKVRVTWKGDAKYYPVTYKGRSLSLKDSDWEEIQSDPTIKGELRKIRDEIRQHEARARSVSENITLNGKRFFTFERFENAYKQGAPTSFIGIFDEYLQTVYNENRIGTYRTYKCAKVSFLKFLKRDDIQVYDITPALLQRFDTYLQNRSATRSTIGIYMRTLRAIFNEAVSSNSSLMEFYPFARRRNEKGKYQIKTGSGKKGDALSLADLKKFIQSQPEDKSQEWEAKQLWLFSFYCQGMNFRDILNLKMKDIQGGYVSYIRNKTKNTEINETKMLVPITEPVQYIISCLVTGTKPDDYVFGTLKPGMNYEQIENAVLQKIKITNKWLKKLCERSDLPVITTYWSRHSYASLLKTNGIPVDFIKELLGHSSARTTETYMRRFDSDRVRAVNTSIQSIVNG